MTTERFTYIVENEQLGTQEFDSYTSMEKYLNLLLKYGEIELTIKRVKEE